MHICTVTVHVQIIFYSFFLSPLSNYFSSSTSTTTNSYMHGYCSCTNNFFILFFSLFYQTTSLPLRLQQPVASPTSTMTQHGKIRRWKKKITTEPPNPTAPPNTATQHKKLTQNLDEIKQNPNEIKAKINQAKLTNTHHHQTQMITPQLENQEKPI